MAGLAGQALTTGGFTAALIAFVVTGVVLVVLLFAAAFTVAVAQQQLTERLRASAPTVKRWGGHILIVVGAWLVVLAMLADSFARVFPV
jgi:TRAP-type C4-dicarboxylate transport system permease large subunit